MKTTNEYIESVALELETNSKNDSNSGTFIASGLNTLFQEIYGDALKDILRDFTLNSRFNKEK